MFGQGTANQRFIDNHDAKQRAHANGDGTTHTEVELAGIDQVTGVAEVIDRKQQRQAAHQRAVGLPFEPVQLGRHFFRANVILGYFIKAAAMDGPKVTLDTFLFLPFRWLAQVIVEPDEVKGRTDPGHASNDVEPADDQAQPFSQICMH